MYFFFLWQKKVFYQEFFILFFLFYPLYFSHTEIFSLCHCCLRLEIATRPGVMLQAEEQEGMKVLGNNHELETLDATYKKYSHDLQLVMWRKVNGIIPIKLLDVVVSSRTFLDTWA